MGRYLSSSLCVVGSPLGGRMMRLYFKLRHIITVLRTLPRPARTLLSPDLHAPGSLLPSPPPSSSVRSGAPTTPKLKHWNPSIAPRRLLRDRAGTYVQAGRYCSTSSRGGGFKAEAPIGVYEEDSQAASPLSLLGVRLGESFNRLAGHINVYFKEKDASPSPADTDAGLVFATPENVGRSPRPRATANRTARERRLASLAEDRDATRAAGECERKLEASQIQTEPGENAPVYSGVQLFHASYLATRFGESYDYVARHINRVFSTSPVPEAQTEEEEPEQDLALRRGSTGRWRRMRSLQTSRDENLKGAERAELKTSAAPAQTSTTHSADAPGNWEEVYLYFANHVNGYFGAKVTDEAGLPPMRDRLASAQQPPSSSSSRTYHQQPFSAPAASVYKSTPLERKDEEQLLLHPKSAGLFHISSISTSFGESYAQMANHVNRYFKGQEDASETDEPKRGGGGGGGGGHWQQTETGFAAAASREAKAVSFMDCLREPSTAIPSLLGGFLKMGPWTQRGLAQPHIPPEVTLKRRTVVSRRQAEETTRALVGILGRTLSPEVLVTCVEELNRHLIKHPACKEVVWKEKAAVKLLRQRRSHKDSRDLQSAIRESLALIGYVDPVKGRGIRVLSIDGGGSRGVVPLQLLKRLEAGTGTPVHQQFDYICGVSTGAVLAFMLGLARFSLDECAEMYRRFGSDVFRQNPLVGTVKMGWSHSYYNTETWETLLREKMGEMVLIKTARDELSPKVSAVSAVVNWGTTPKAFIFRNYNHTPGCLSRYAGASGYRLWQAVRASSAAPGYFQEFPLHSDIHQDGGIILNNPCALAVHESRLLWPDQPFQCVLSLGTGRYDNAARRPGSPATSTSLWAKVSSLICSATDTEGVHTLLDDLLPPDVYFRFNPTLSAGVPLDESRPGALDRLEADTQAYLDRNGPKLARLRLVLGAERTGVGRAGDWVRGRAWEVRQSWK